MKERRVLNDPKGLLEADFGQIPVVILLDVMVRTAFFVLWAMQHRWDSSALHFLRGQRNTGGSCCLMRVRLAWPRTLFFWSSHPTAFLGVQEMTYCPFSSAGTLPNANKTRRRRNSV